MLSDLLEAFHRGTGQFSASKPERISGFVNEKLPAELEGVREKLRELGRAALQLENLLGQASRSMQAGHVRTREAMFARSARARKRSRSTS
jgi:hypothetical protein